MYRYENPRPVYPNELFHYGVKGMHWGVRRYQPYRKGKKSRIKMLHDVRKRFSAFKKRRMKYPRISNVDNNQIAARIHQENNRLFTENAIRTHQQNVNNAMQIHNDTHYLNQIHNDNINYVNQLHAQQTMPTHFDTFTHMPMHPMW